MKPRFPAATRVAVLIATLGSLWAHTTPVLAEDVSSENDSRSVRTEEVLLPGDPAFPFLDDVIGKEDGPIYEQHSHPMVPAWHEDPEPEPTRAGALELFPADLGKAAARRGL